MRVELKLYPAPEFRLDAQISVPIPLKIEPQAPTKDRVSELEAEVERLSRIIRN